MLRSASSRAAHRRPLALLSAALLLAPAACDQAPSASAELLDERLADVLPVVSPNEPAALPDDREAMLRALAPLPSDAILVVYEVEGPGGIEGSLEVLARPGGYRRENWTIHVPLGAEQERRLAGSIIQTPDGVFIEGSGAETFSPSPLGALADAALALDDDTLRGVLEQLDARRATLAQARSEAGSDSEHILDVPCHVTRVGTIEMCLWEDTGLPLRYASDGLQLHAVNIDDEASIGEHAFEVPFATTAATPAGFDASDALRRLARGELAELSPYLHPGLRLPST